MTPTPKKIYKNGEPRGVPFPRDVAAHHADFSVHLTPAYSFPFPLSPTSIITPMEPWRLETGDWRKGSFSLGKPEDRK